ncbi:putative peptidyl-prolyl cis-trans isomerase [Leptospira yasudae]|uniref:Peptidyl-prolyl cis-trans isomerase n=1 Tax=Leptospira yasudae TaxID=2202201 RepID=A0ABX9LXS1_9LEPT|nr:putative peptidyl-prolyl cis-trans isomerase [Leptospira yasudae]TGK26323.1 putative peptidyl-prolyl cis-trans isomerase [Leptospira yasudae]TGM08623.1 putative peptidyl-prolyl cis-trans isomerase [Leptospira yasudae]
MKRQTYAKTFFFAGMFGFLFLQKTVQPAESLNRVIATVGTVSISELDLDDATEKYNRLQKHLKHEDYRKSLRTRVIDFLIDRAIVDVIAEEESVQVNEQRVESEIEKRMEVMGVANRKQFEKAMESSSGMPFELWVTELPYQIKKGQLLQLKVAVPPPSESEIRNWYNQNKDKVGFEIRYRIISVAPDNDSVQEENRLYKEVSEIRKSVISDPSSFALIAGSPRNDPTLRARRGLVEWISSFDLYKYSKVTASIAAPLPNGGVSEVFRDERKRYCVLKIEGKRPTPMENLRGGIQNILYRDKEEDTFHKWLKETRAELPIQIFDDAYRKENKIPLREETFHLD